MLKRGFHTPDEKASRRCREALWVPWDICANVKGAGGQSYLVCSALISRSERETMVRAVPATMIHRTQPSVHSPP